MKLLVVTQKINKNDDVLGFFHAWIEEFSRRSEKVTVICLEKGEYDLPKNVSVFSLGKEAGASRLAYVFRFYRLIWNERKNYDSVFVHMNPEYVVLGGLFWKMLRKRVVLWYTHRNVDLKLRIAEKFADRIATAAKESFRLNSKKVAVLGHGIEVEKFVCPAKTIEDGKLRILHMGRITKIKNCNILIKTLKILQEKIPEAVLFFAGTPVTEEDMAYMESLRQLIKENGLEKSVIFSPVRYNEIAKAFSEADITCNLTPPGGIDKAVLSGLVSGRATFVSNTALAPIFGEYKDRFIFSYCDPSDLAEKIRNFLEASDQGHVLHTLSERVKREYSVERVVSKILALYETSR